MASQAMKLGRQKPVSINLTCSAMCWKQVGKLVEFEIAQRGWTYTHCCALAVHPVTDQPMSYSTLRKLIDGDYWRGGPFIATLQRVFLMAFRSSGYSLLLTTEGTYLQRGRAS